MAPAPGPASPLESPSNRNPFIHSIHAPASPPPTPSPAPPDYSNLIQSLQSRRPRQAAPSAVSSDLEADLQLAAQIGQSLLQEKAALQARLETSEKANGKLVDRLARAVKENKSLERRFEETVSSLEQSESSNRNLLSSLETERKTISRLSHDSGKLVATAKSYKALQQQHADSLQELESERRRADGAEAKARKMAERVRELEERLGKAIQDLEEMRQDKVLKESKRGENQTGLQEVKARHQARLASSSQAAANARAILGSGSSTPEGSHADNPEAKELLKMVETLVEENQLLRSESMELHGLLEKEREEIEASRSRLAEEAEIQEEGEEDDGRDLSGETDHFATHSRAGSVTSTSSFGEVQQSVRRGGPRRPTPVSSQSTGLIGPHARMPVRRGHGRRSMSMDVTPQLRAVLPIGSAPNSPQPDRPHYSPLTRPASVFSSDATDDPNADTASVASSSIPLSRSTRRQRPLSLSLGPSVFPLVPEDEDQTDRPISPFTRQPGFAHRRRSSQMSGGAVSLNGLGISSPLLDGSQSRSPRLSRGPAELVDATTQTIPPATPPRSGSPLPPPENDVDPSTSAFSDPQAQLLRDISASPASRHSSLHAPTPAAASETRTAALGQLIEHVSKLLARVLAADIATQEKRLRKQQLAGDVRFLAQANLKDLLTDIDSVRHHFRRVVEQERSTQTRQTSLTASSAPASNPDTSLITRRDFVSLVKLLRDLLFEASRLRMLVNRVQLEPALAEKLKELDVPDALEAVKQQGANGKSAAAASMAAAGLLAPLSRLFGGVVGHEEPPSFAHPPSTAHLRPPPAKRGGSGTVSTATATVSVEFGGGAVRQAQAAETASTTSPKTAPAGARSGIQRAAGSSHVRRDLSSIFAGASSMSRATAATAASSDLWASAPRSSNGTSLSQLGAPAGRLATAASSYIPFGRLLSSYRPAMSSTTNAVLDSMTHATSHHATSVIDEEGGFEPPPTLLERQLRPRGLSDSSIRSTFISHANPHHRLVPATGLALSSEPVTIPVVVAPDSSSVTNPSSSLSTSASPAAAISALRQTLLDDALEPSPGRSVSRRPSAVNLRSKSSSAQLRETLNTAVPVLSTSTGTTDSSVTLLDHQQHPTPAVKVSEPIAIDGPEAMGGGGAASLIGTVVSSAFGSLTASAGNEVGGRRMAGRGPSERVAESWRERSRLV
ncbi:hypothetical protein Rt10032_c07g3101 [Rhodotorula toruloides]|uniref:Uncharacterized protein n=1 Tax=Rhodotorula toruloides TaxID=5286 RepID=A0A511KI06_RHOTO|nr:hypothetical protein Rt10032_c07g3101 [Rhodotorula toruloides]